MAYSMYQASIPVLARGLQALSAFLAKAETDLAARKIDPAVLVSSRLAPDMHPFSRQVQIACDMAKGGAARLAGIEAPSYADTETSFEELRARIAKTLDFVQSVTEAQFEGAETRAITIKTPFRDLNFTGEIYLPMFVLPNFYFHCTAAYLILRHNGVPLGKMDFMGAI